MHDEKRTMNTNDIFTNKLTTWCGCRLKSLLYLIVCEFNKSVILFGEL